MLKKSKVIWLICIIEILFFLPRIVSQTVHYFIPINFFGIPFVQLTFFFSLVMLVIVLNLKRKVPKLEFFIFCYILLVMTFSFLFSPPRDSYFEVQGILMFLIDFAMFRIATFNNKPLALKLIKTLVITISVFIISFILFFVFSPNLIPLNFVENNNIRMEGFITSSIAVGLFAASSIFNLKQYKNKFIFFLGLSAVIILLIVTITRTVIITIVIMGLLTWLFQSNKKSFIAKLKQSLFLLMFVMISINLTKDYLSDYTQLIEYRFTNKKGNSVSYRSLELQQELFLFSQSPIVGKGVGLRYTKEYFVNSSSVFYGHNFFTSQLLRFGLFGLLIGLMFLNHLYKTLYWTKNENDLLVLLAVLFIGMTLVLLYANFIYFLIFGFYGALLGLISNLKDEKNISINSDSDANFVCDLP